MALSGSKHCHDSSEPQLLWPPRPVDQLTSPWLNLFHQTGLLAAPGTLQAGSLFIAVPSAWNTFPRIIPTAKPSLPAVFAEMPSSGGIPCLLRSTFFPPSHLLPLNIRCNLLCFLLCLSSPPLPTLLRVSPADQSSAGFLDLFRGLRKGHGTEKALK